MRAVEGVNQIDRDHLEMTCKYISEKMEKLKPDCGITDDEKATILQLITQTQSNLQQFTSARPLHQTLAQIEEVSQKIKLSREMITELDDERQKIISIKSELLQSKSKLNNPSPNRTSGQDSTHILEWDKMTPYIHAHFQVEGNTVTRLDSGAWYQVASTQPVRPSAIYRARVVRYGGKSSVYIGLVVGDKKGEKWSGNKKDSVAYWSWIKYKNWEVYLDGDKQDSGTEGALPEGGVLRV